MVVSVSCSILFPISNQALGTFMPLNASFKSQRTSESSYPALPSIPKRAKFSSPPPPPDMARLQLISNQAQQISKAPSPPPPPPPPHSPPPPPPPLPLSTPCKTGGSQRSVLSTASPQMVKTTLRSSTPKTTPRSEDTRPSEEENGDVNSLERHDSSDTDPSRPKLKPLHWDKVRVSSDQSKVKDPFSNLKLHMAFCEIRSGFREIRDRHGFPLRILVAGED